MLKKLHLMVLNNALTSLQVNISSRLKYILKRRKNENAFKKKTSTFLNIHQLHFSVCQRLQIYSLPAPVTTPPIKGGKKKEQIYHAQTECRQAFINTTSVAGPSTYELLLGKQYTHFVVYEKGGSGECTFDLQTVCATATSFCKQKSCSTALWITVTAFL